jgi:hypothetical protein
VSHLLDALFAVPLLTLVAAGAMEMWDELIGKRVRK